MPACRCTRSGSSASEPDCAAAGSGEASSFPAASSGPLRLGAPELFAAIDEIEAGIRAGPAALAGHPLVRRPSPRDGGDPARAGGRLRARRSGRPWLGPDRRTFASPVPTPRTAGSATSSSKRQTTAMPLARQRVRNEEIAELVPPDPPGHRPPVHSSDPVGGASRSVYSTGEAFGWAEAPQGEVLYLVAVEDGRLVAGQASFGLVPQPRCLPRRLPQGHPDRLRLHRGELRGLDRGSSQLMPWIPRGLREGIVTTRYPRRPDGYGDGFSGARSWCTGAARTRESTRRSRSARLLAIAQRRGQRPTRPGALHPVRAVRRVEPRGTSPRSRLRGRRRRPVGPSSCPRPTRTTRRWKRSRRELHRRVRALRRSIHVRHVDAGSDGSEEWEVAALTNPDLRRAAPRDLLHRQPQARRRAAGDRRWRRRDARPASPDLRGHARAQGRHRGGHRRHQRRPRRHRATPRAAESLDDGSRRRLRTGLAPDALRAAARHLARRRPARHVGCARAGCAGTLDEPASPEDPPEEAGP